ncbi:MAG: hypothetical protein JWO42_1143, partial [Chloroflexi bacterium]|nr:hypothetical protein [Chloroflexota bacterium]
VVLDIQGTLAAAPSSASSPTVLCVLKAHVISNAMTPKLGVTSPCPTGQLPVYLTASTKLVNRDGIVVALNRIDARDSLVVNGTFINMQFTALKVRDLSLHAYYVTVVGKILYVSPFTHPTYFTLQVQDQSDKVHISTGSVLTIYVQWNTKIFASGGVGNKVTALNPGQVVTVLGIYNRGDSNFSKTLRVRAH